MNILNIYSLLSGAELIYFFTIRIFFDVRKEKNKVEEDSKELSEKILSLMLEQPWWLAWALMAILPACLEELLFRGWVLSAFCGEKPSKQRMAVAVFAQALCFAIFHLLPERMPQTFLLGIALGAIVLLTKSIYPAILCHIANNSMPLLLLYLTGIQNKDALPESVATDVTALSLPPLAIACPSRPYGWR